MTRFQKSAAYRLNRIDFEISRSYHANMEEITLTPIARRAYTIAEAATELRMSEKSVRRQIERNRLRRCKSFGRILIPAKDVDTFFDRNS
jgi:excisionase family DNA binding protein